MGSISSRYVPAVVVGGDAAVVDDDVAAFQERKTFLLKLSPADLLASKREIAL